jgi:hypothetical protein
MPLKYFRINNILTLFTYAIFDAEKCVFLGGTLLTLAEISASKCASASPRF